MPNDMIFGVNLIPNNDNEESLGNSNKKWIAYLDSINGQTAETVLLPTVTSSNNGNVLMVSNGAWNTSPMDTFTRQFWTSQTTVSIPLSANGKSYLIWSAGTSNGTSGALMDSTYGSLTFVSNGQYAVIQKGSAITISVNNSNLVVTSTSAVKMGIVEL